MPEIPQYSSQDWFYPWKVCRQSQSYRPLAIPTSIDRNPKIQLALPSKRLWFAQVNPDDLSPEIIILQWEQGLNHVVDFRQCDKPIAQHYRVTPVNRDHPDETHYP